MTELYAAPPPAAEPIYPDDDPALGPDELLEMRAQHNRLVSSEVQRLRIRHEARAWLAAETASQIDMPAFTRLDDFLRRPVPPVTHCVDRLWPAGGNVLLAAQWKAGKTTMRDNVIRSLVDGSPFLGQFQVLDPGATVALLDFELDEHTLQRWLHDQGLTHPDHVFVIAMKGRASTFNLLDESTRARWATALRAVGATRLVVDCLRPILDALGLDENHDAGRFLEPFDALGVEAGIREKLLVHHMGHSGDRSRGDSRLQDWPDALWKLTRLKSDEDPSVDDPAGPRFFSAYGRDVNQPEGELTFDPDTRRLSLGRDAAGRAETRSRRKAEAIANNVWKVIRDNPGINTRGIREACKGLGRSVDVDKAVALLKDDRRIVIASGARGALQHTVIET